MIISRGKSAEITFRIATSRCGFGFEEIAAEVDIIEHEEVEG